MKLGLGTNGSRIEITFQNPVSSLKDFSSSGMELTARCLPISSMNMSLFRVEISLEELLPTVNQDPKVAIGLPSQGMERDGL
jgi:hypothetical protein